MSEFDRQAKQVELEREVTDRYNYLITRATGLGLHALARHLRREKLFHRDMMRKAYHE